MPHVVLLEDELNLRDIFRLTMKLTGLDIELHEFIDSDTTLEFIQQSWKIIDLYVLDIRVPGKMNGFELAQHIRSYDKETPIILSSAYIKTPKVQLDFYNIEWMKKPWEVATLLDKVMTIKTSYKQT